MEGITPRQRRLRRLYGVKLAILFATIAVSLFCIHKIDSDAWWVSHTHQVQKEVYSCLGNIRDVDASLRGYVITRNVRYLGLVEGSWKETEDDLATLTSITSDNPVQQAHISRLIPLVKKRREIAAQIINAPPDKVAEIIKASPNSDTIESIRLTGKMMVSEEDRLLAIRQREIADRVYQASVVLPVFLLASIAITIWSYYMIDVRY